MMKNLMLVWITSPSWVSMVLTCSLHMLLHDKQQNIRKGIIGKKHQNLGHFHKCVGPTTSPYLISSVMPSVTEYWWENIFAPKNILCQGIQNMLGEILENLQRYVAGRDMAITPSHPPLGQCHIFFSIFGSYSGGALYLQFLLTYCFTFMDICYACDWTSLSLSLTYSVIPGVT